MKQIGILLVLLLLAVAVGVFSFVFSSTDRALLFSRPEHIERDGLTRSYRVVVPDQTTNMPLVIALHGYRVDSAKRFEFYSGFSNLASEEGFVIAYPYGIDQSWNGEICCGAALEQQLDDVGFIQALIEHLKQTYDIDDSRIYVVGMSNGGVLAQHLLAELPDVFAAGAAVMGGVGDDDHSLEISRATAPILLVQGKQDHYAANTKNERESEQSSGYQFLSAEETRTIWATHYGLGNPTITSYGTLDIYRYGDISAPQVASYVYDTGHQWPEWRFSYPFVRIPNSTKKIWDFLSKYSL